MADGNHEPIENKELEKTGVEKTEVEKKQPDKGKKISPRKSPKDTTGKNKGEDKGVVKKLPLKKETAAKGQGAAKTPPPAKKQTVAALRKFIKGAWAELKKVHWPNRRELITFTGVVLVAVTIVAAMIFVVDSILGKLLEVIIPK